MDKWMTARTKNVGFLWKVHPTQTWKDDLKAEMREMLKGVTCEGIKRDEWEQNNGNSEEGVTNFALLHENKGFGTGNNRVFTKMLSVETKLEDVEYLKLLIWGATGSGELKATFIEAGYHLSVTPKS